MTKPPGATQPDAGSEAAAPRLRQATAQDLPAIVRLLADDPLGAKRECYREPLPASYQAAFAAIERDPNQELCVACLGESVVGVLQLTFIPYLTYQGGWRALIEGVRIAPGLRSRGLGRILFEWAIERARDRGCHMVQLTSDKARPDAIRFYQGLGFVASHEGMKLLIPSRMPSGPGPDTR
ncbi:MAG: GNAT family N-acetyltransferase [Betaproteobacteria bacterium]|nr:GNAT family N-acetyltransferase [Betaproteobacteria bacterium]